MLSNGYLVGTHRVIQYVGFHVGLQEALEKD